MRPLNLKWKNILVAGGSGLVGMNLVNRLVQERGNVLATYCSRKPSLHTKHFQKFDFTRFDDCLKATKSQDIVFICSAKTFGVKEQQENPSSMLLPNLQINAGLVEAARLNGVGQVVFVSSSIVYQTMDKVISEPDLDLNIMPSDIYRGTGWMKRYSEILLQYYAERFGLKVTIVRPTNIYGPFDKFDEQHAHVIPSLIRRALKKEDPFKVWGNGLQQKDFIYVDDFVEDLILLAEKNTSSQPINVAGGQSVSIKDLAGLILNVCGHKTTPSFEVNQPVTSRNVRLSTERYQEILGHSSRTSLQDGLIQTVAWAKQQKGLI